MAANDANKLNETVQRPWVKLEGMPNATGPLVLESDSGGYLTLKFHVRNVGHTPAVATKVDTKLTMSNITDLTTTQAEFCKRVRVPLNPGSYRIAPVTIFPQDDAFLDTRASFDTEEFRRFEAWVRKIPASAQPIACLAIIGCAHYEFAAQTQRHATGIIFDLLRRDPNAPDGTSAFELEGTTAPRDLVIRPNLLGSAPID
jgi:hypothetical protein